MIQVRHLCRKGLQLNSLRAFGVRPYTRQRKEGYLNPIKEGAEVSLTQNYLDSIKKGAEVSLLYGDNIWGE